MAVDLAPLRALRDAGKADDALAQAVALASRHPDDSELRYVVACLHDARGEEALAIPHYEAALAGDGLSRASRRGAIVGLGSSLRCLGRYREAQRVLEDGLADFPDDGAMRAFLAITRHNLGRSQVAVQELLVLLVQTSSDEGIRAYARALAFYAEDVDRRWD
jgi:tetratricopeptide (TPR) repeat protein